MRNPRCYYSADIETFLRQSDTEIFGIICSNASNHKLILQQSNAWKDEIRILKAQLNRYAEGRIIIEYIIPRMGKRADIVFLHKNIVFLLEFKCREFEYTSSAYNQVYDYALDLQNFQKESRNKLIVPIIVATDAHSFPNTIIEHNRVLEPLRCNKDNISTTIQQITDRYNNEIHFDYLQWEFSEYYPTPTIVEAAQALYRGHKVENITRSDADAHNLSETMDAVKDIIEYSKNNKKKSICFVTGVPGAGKTLVGLTLSIEFSDAANHEHAVFLSGNQPLVTVLQEALARDKIMQAKEQGLKITKQDALRSTSALIQIIHKYRDSFVGNDNVPPEKITIFDEAQRAWTHEQIEKFMRTKKGIESFEYSEPEFLIQTMDRHKDWAVIVCLVGGGQEINTGEAGLPEWFDALRRSFANFEIFISPQLNDTEYCRTQRWSDVTKGLNVHEIPDLHLATSIRSFRTPSLASFVKSILDADIESAKRYYETFKDKYPIFLTRDIAEAKEWIKSMCHGTTRYGLLASSGALRLKPSGIFVKNSLDVANWFLNDKYDVRSSYYLEDVATEFDIQGLELDYTLVAWDADFRFEGADWNCYRFSGNEWQNLHSYDSQLYLKNAYRVLLTRARQGMAIYIPKGDEHDHSRLPSYYNKTYAFLAEAMGLNYR